MSNIPFGSPGGPGPFYERSTTPAGSAHHSFFSLVVLIVAVVAAAALVLGMVLWTLGLVFSIAGFLIKVALVIAVAALVWRRIASRRRGYRRGEY